jgi:hypothetical protein
MFGTAKKGPDTTDCVRWWGPILQVLAAVIRLLAELIHVAAR